MTGIKKEVKVIVSDSIFYYAQDEVNRALLGPKSTLLSGSLNLFIRLS